MSSNDRWPSSLRDLKKRSPAGSHLVQLRIVLPDGGWVSFEGAVNVDEKDAAFKLFEAMASAKLADPRSDGSELDGQKAEKGVKKQEKHA